MILAADEDREPMMMQRDGSSGDKNFAGGDGMLVTGRVGASGLCPAGMGR